MEEKDIIYVENETLSIIKLYTEGYLLSKEKGFNTMKERTSSLERLKENIRDILTETSEELNTSIEEIVRIIRKCLNGEVSKNHEEEYILIERILQDIGERER